MAFKKEESKALAPVAETTAVAVIEKADSPLAVVGAFDDLGLPTSMQAFMEENPTFGQEDFAMSDLATPYLAILQTNSPQVNPTNEKYIDGASAGMIFNTITGQTFLSLAIPNKAAPEGVLVICVKMIKRMIEWVSRDNGGGFVAAYELNDPVIRTLKPHAEKRGVLINPKTGNEVRETAYHYVLALPPSGPEFAVVALSSTGLSLHKRWDTLIASRKETRLVNGQAVIKSIPGIMQIFRLTTKGESNKQGSWFGYQVEPVGLLNTESVFKEALEYRKKIEAGEIKTGDLAEVAGESGSAEEIPF